MHQLQIIPPVEKTEELQKLFDQFFSFSVPKTTTAKSLAIELAKRTRFLRDNVISEELKEEKVEGTQTLESFYSAFKNHLISTLTLEEFSDIFAQTITYGLFAARIRTKGEFNRKLAYENISHTVGILRNVFRFISSSDLPKSMEWIVDDIAEVLAAADVNKIIENFYKEGKGRDPIVHFYETFLAEYDPKLREKRGVYYTPEPVVSYIVRSVHKLLKEKFEKSDGFATSGVTVLDPAAGTLTFPAFAIRQSIEEIKGKYGDGGVKSLIKDHVLKDFYAFELMMAPYAVGHLKISLVLDDYNYKLSDDERFNLFLTNTLEFTKEDPNKLPGIFEQAIAKESAEALKVKEDVPVIVVMGNPPYAVKSSNIVLPGTDFYNFYESYKEVVRKVERNIQPLSDDYIKFLAFAHWKINQAEHGIVGMITNNSYLAGLIHRDMRRKLLEDFDQIYILNLHGSPESSRTDENVFDIKQEVAIALLIKNRKLSKSIKYADLLGSREYKYSYLEKDDVKSTSWKEIKPKSPYYFFAESEKGENKNYEKFISVSEIFGVKDTGIKTSLDNLVIDFDKQALLARIRSLRDQSNSLEFVKNSLHLEDKRSGWSVVKARQRLTDIDDWEKYVQQILYRPFDRRWIYYHPAVVLRPREGIMKHMLKPNLALIVTRQFSSRKNFVVFVSDNLTEISSNPYASYVVNPLYTYNEETAKQISLLESQEGDGKKSNISPLLIESLEKSYGNKPSSDDVFNYIYAILYSNRYREKYKDSLKRDFPRIPFSRDIKIFNKLASLGLELVNLHLLKSTSLNDPQSKFPGSGNNVVEKVNYSQIEKRVYINNSQHFTNIEPEDWDSIIGGYKVLEKWLKDRRGRIINHEEIKQYCQIVTAIKDTLKVQGKIDEVYLEVEKSLI